MLSIYEIDWQDVVRQCLPALERHHRRLEAQSQAQRNPPSSEHASSAAAEDHCRVDHVPRSLLMDTRLTPLERNAWQVLQWLIHERQLSAPRYEDLQPYLATSPCGAKASRETIARALNVLRLTRWISQVARMRDDRGCLRGCAYVLHESPLSPKQAMALDHDYLLLVQQSLDHAAKGVRDVAQSVREELRADTTLTVETVMSIGSSSQDSRQQNLPLERASVTQYCERSEISSVRNANAGQHEFERSANAPVLAEVRHPNSACTIQEENKNRKKTVQTREPAGELRWPDNLNLSGGERQLANRALDQLEPEKRQAVINEAAVRCASGGIRKPGAYLMGLIKRACNGEFTLWAARAVPVQPRLTAEPLHAQVPVPVPIETRRSSAKTRSASPLALACLRKLKQRCGVVSGTA
ncbi:MAG: STY4528 family pathogenicity island replication protein [Pseudomonas sp.]